MLDSTQTRDLSHALLIALLVYIVISHSDGREKSLPELSIGFPLPGYERRRHISPVSSGGEVKTSSRAADLFCRPTMRILRTREVGVN